MSESAIRHRYPIIPLVVDGTLAIALLSAVYMGGQFVERLDQVILGMEKLSGRVEALESRPMGPEAARRISVLEADQRSQKAAFEMLGETLTSRLDRIEGKIDRLGD